MIKRIFLLTLAFIAALCILSCATTKVTKEPPRVLKAYAPHYPVEQMVYLTEGKVLIKSILTKEGQIKDPKVVKSEPEGIFDKAALYAIERYVFEPAKENGKPVDSIVSVPLKFSLDKRETNIKTRKATIKGLEHMKVGEYKQAIEDFTEAIKLTKNYLPAYISRGEAYSIQGKHKEAILDFDTAINIAPKTGSCYNLRGQAFSKLGESQKMCLDFIKACEFGDCTEFDHAKKLGKCTE